MINDTSYSDQRVVDLFETRLEDLTSGIQEMVTDDLDASIAQIREDLQILEPSPAQRINSLNLIAHQFVISELDPLEVNPLLVSIANASDSEMTVTAVSFTLSCAREFFAQREQQLSNRRENVTISERVMRDALTRCINFIKLTLQDVEVINLDPVNNTVNLSQGRISDNNGIRISLVGDDVVEIFSQSLDSTISMQALSLGHLSKPLAYHFALELLDRAMNAIYGSDYVSVFTHVRTPQEILADPTTPLKERKSIRLDLIIREMDDYRTSPQRKAELRELYSRIWSGEEEP